jgi:hypothetical protein
MPTPERKTFGRIVHIETRLWNRCDAELRRRTGLSLGRLEVLRVIAEVKQCRVGDIVTRLLITVVAFSRSTAGRDSLLFPAFPSIAPPNRESRGLSNESQKTATLCGCG